MEQSANPQEITYIHESGKKVLRWPEGMRVDLDVVGESGGRALVATYDSCYTVETVVFSRSVENVHLDSVLQKLCHDHLQRRRRVHPDGLDRRPELVYPSGGWEGEEAWLHPGS